MKITAIKRQVKRAGRFSIFVDNRYAFSLSQTALLEHKVFTGQEVSREEVGKYKRISAGDRLYNNVLHFTALRPRSTWELKQYLRRKQASPTSTKMILNKLSKSGMVNDEAFAKAWVDSRRLLKPTSRRRLQAELRAKRVPEDIVKHVLDNDETNERHVLHELVTKKRHLLKYRDDKLKLMQYLHRQGFSYDDIKAAVDEEV